MKNTFRKVVSVVLAVMMLVSLCTVAITTASAATTSFADNGVYSGTGAEDRFLVDDPTGTGDKVIKMAYGNGRYNYRLADPADTSKPFVVVKGTYYTIKFEYMVNAVGAETNDFGFETMYGLTDKGGHGRKSASMLGTSGISVDFIGDGKWHSAAITFLANPFEVTETVVTGQDPETGEDITETNVIATLNNIYFTYYNPVGVDGYLKNITIVAEENAIGGYSNTEYDMLAYVNADGTANENRFNGTNASGMTGSFKNTETGNLVVVPTSNNNGDLGGLNGVQYLTLYKNKPLQMAAGNTYSVVAKYKVNEVSADSTAGVEFGIGYSRGTGIGWSETNIAAVNSHKIATDEWHYITATVTPPQAQYLRLYVRGKSSKIEIDYVQVSATGMDNAVNVIYNDNGVISTKAGYKGTDIIVEGSNGANGETLMGWCADANCATTAVTKVPAESATLFAKYPTVVIDRFAMLPNYASGTQRSASTWAASADGWSYSGTSNSGFLLPAYEDSTVAFYEFVNGVQYDVKIYYTSVTVTGGTKSSVNLYYGDGYGSDYVRTSQVPDASVALATTTEPGCITYSFEHKTTTKTQNNVLHTVNTAILRPSDSSSVTGAINIDRIEITEKSEENTCYIPVEITIDDGVNEPTTNNYYLGDLIVLPEAPEKDGYMFVGWYDTSVDFSMYNEISESLIPVSALRVDKSMLGKSITYAPKYISTATETIDFEESYYSGNDVKGNPWNATGSSCGDRSAAFYIQNDAEHGNYMYVNNGTTNNIYKFQLFDGNGKHIVAYQGVTYKISMTYEVVTAGKDVAIGISRANIGGFMPMPLSGMDQGCDKFGSCAEVGLFENVEHTLTATNMYRILGNDSSAGGVSSPSAFAVMVKSGEVKVYEVSITPVSYTAPAVEGIKNGTVKIDYENGTVTAIPDEGYEVSAAGMSAVQTYVSNYKLVTEKEQTAGADTPDDTSDDKYKTTTYCDINGTRTTADDANPIEHFSSMTVAEGGSTADGVTFKFDNTIEGAKLSTYRFIVDFVKTDANNADFIAVSVREEKAAADNDGVYQSAGIRFRARVSASTVANATEIGYIIVPTKAITDKEVDSVEAYMALGGGVEAKGIAKKDDKHIIYTELGENFYDYQAVLTGLTNEAGTKNLTNLELSVALYITTAEGTEYFEVDRSVKYSDYAK